MIHKFTHKAGRIKLPVGWANLGDSILVFYSFIYATGSTAVYYDIIGKARILLGCLRF